MLLFTLAISCLTTSNLPWFMDLTFQAPMHYCSLQHQTLHPLPVISTTGCCGFGLVSSFFLELFLHSSPIAYWAPTVLGSFSFSILSFLPFSTVHGVLKARILKWFAIPFSSGPHSVKKKKKKSKISVWGSLTKTCEKRGSEKQMRKGKIYPFECRIQKNSKER